MRQRLTRWIVATVMAATMVGCAPEPLPPLEPLPVRPVDLNAQRQLVPPDPTAVPSTQPTTAPSSQPASAPGD